MCILVREPHLPAPDISLYFLLGNCLNVPLLLDKVWRREPDLVSPLDAHCWFVLVHCNIRFSLSCYDEWHFVCQFLLFISLVWNYVICFSLGKPERTAERLIAAETRKVI